MLKLIEPTLSVLKMLDLLSIAGIAVPPQSDRVEARVLNDNIEKTISSKGAVISPSKVANATCIKAIYKTSQGIVAMVEGTHVNKAVAEVIAVIANMMTEQKLTYVCFPAISNGQGVSFNVSDNTCSFMIMSNIADLQTYGDRVFFLTISDQKQLKETTISDMLNNSNWKKQSTLVYNFHEKVRGLGRVNKDGILSLTMLSSKRIAFNLKNKKPLYLSVLAPENTIYMGKYKLSKEFNLAVSLFVGRIQMLFMNNEPDTQAAI